MKEKKKVNSYVKMILWMALGGAVGAGMSMGSSIAEDGMRAMMEGASIWMAEHTVIIMCVLAAVCLVTTILCYAKGESIIKKFQDDVEDEIVEDLDKKYDFWQTIGVVVCSGMIYISMTIFGFAFRMDSKTDAFNLLYAVVPFLIGALISVFYQIAVVKQMRRKDPSKHGDAADINFEKVWMKSCDEGEKIIIYQASYRAYRVMKSVLIVALLIALSSHLFFGTGMTAVVLLGMCNVIMLVAYTVCAYKIQKAPQNA